MDRIIIEEIEENVTYGANYTISLPVASDKDDGSSHFSRYYNRLRERISAFAEQDPVRVRNYRCSFKVKYDEATEFIEVTLTARIKERGQIPKTHTRILCDRWSHGQLISHSSTEKDAPGT